MDSRDRERLQRHYARMLDVTYSVISPHLISTFIITLEMHEEIDSRPTDRKKMEKLLSILPSRGGNAMRELINALKPSYRWIATELERDTIDSSRAYSSVRNNNNHRNMRIPEEISIGDYLPNITRILQEHPCVSTNWTFLAHSMSLLPTTIMDIRREMSFSGGHKYAIFTVLQEWISKVGNTQATFSKLISILEQEGMRACGEDIKELWVQLAGDPYPTNHYGESRANLPQYAPVITDV